MIVKYNKLVHNCSLKTSLMIFRCPETSSVDESIVPDFPKRKIYINATVKEIPGS
jgi:hypothetical protein